MNPQFKRWAQNKLSSNAVQSYMHGINTVERAYGDLEKHFNEGTFDEIVRELEYSSRDERRGIPNPTKIQIARNVAKTLSNYRSQVGKYKQFLMEISAGEGYEYREAASDMTNSDTDWERGGAQRDGAQFEIERHLQEELRQEIEQLEEGLEIADGGYERKVDSGYIDILAKDSEGYWVVIELKRGGAPHSAITQIAGYMYDIQEEEGTEKVRGILVAGDFDKRCIGAAQMIPNLTLHRYRFSFDFEELTG